MQRVGGMGVRVKFSTVSQILPNVFPDYEWLPWRFEHTPPNFWEDVNNQKKFMKWAEKQLKINEKSDWYNVSYRVKIGKKGVPKIPGILRCGRYGSCQQVWVNTRPSICNLPRL